MSAASPFPAALRLVCIADLDALGRPGRLEAAVRGGVTAVWLRDPAASGRALFEATEATIARVRPLGAAVLVADRADVAAAAGADGVQLGRRAPPVAALRAWWGGWLGVSCHDEREVRDALLAGADHVVLSPVHEVPGKGPALAPERVASLVAGAAPTPVVVLGGVDAARAAAWRARGAAGVAVHRALRDAADPEAAARALAGSA